VPGRNEACTLDCSWLALYGGSSPARRVRHGVDRCRDASYGFLYASGGRPRYVPRHGAYGKRHWGIRGMRERAARTGAALEFNGVPGRGTTVVLHMRVEADGTDRSGV